MASKSPPAFQLYPDSWLSSKDICLMTPAEEGAYFRLLCYAWLEEDCGLPDDDGQLAALSRLGRAWKKGSGEKLRAKFVARGGRLFNERLLHERTKLDDWRRRATESGKQGAKSRWGGDRVAMLTPSKNNGHPIGEAPALPSKSDGHPIETPLRKNGSSSPSPFPFPLAVESSPTPPLEASEKYQRFDAVLAAWPEGNRVGQDEAARIWIVLVDAGSVSASADEVLEGLERWKQSERWADADGKYIPSMAKWLREKLWKDHPKQADVRETW